MRKLAIMVVLGVSLLAAEAQAGCCGGRGFFRRGFVRSRCAVRSSCGSYSVSRSSCNSCNSCGSAYTYSHVQAAPHCSACQ
jgi:hypothetical protein